MKIKISKDTLMKLGVLIFLLFDCRFFYVIKLPERWGGAASNKYMLTIASILIFLIYLLESRRIKIGKFGFYIIAFYGILLINAIAMKIQWHYRDTQIIWFIIPYLILLMYFVMVDFFQKYVNYKFFLKCAEVACICVGILMITQVIYWDIEHILFLDVNVISRYWNRYNIRLRLYGYCDGLMRITILLSANEIMSKGFRWKGNKLHFIALFVSFVSIVYVDQSRVYLLVEIVALLAMYLENKREGLKIRKLHALFLIIILIIAIYFFRNKMLSLVMSLLSSEDGSHYARVEGVTYFFRNFMDWVFVGYGIVIPERTSSAYNIIKGTTGIYNYDDIGIMGVFVSFGILGLMWYLLLLIKLWRVSKIKSPNRALNKGLFVAFALAILTQSYLDRGRLVSLMLTLSIMGITNPEQYMGEGG